MVAGETGDREDTAAQDGPRAIGVPGERTVNVLVGGLPDGLPLVLHHGTPGGLASWPAMDEAARRRGLCLITPARPGYAGSTPRPGRRVADVASDVAAVLDALGCDAFVTAGWSGGGPHALACAAMLHGRCLAAATVAGVAPYQADGLDWLAGMGPENIKEFGAAAQGEAALTALLSDAAGGLATIAGTQLAAELGGLLSSVDAGFLTGEFADYLAASMRSACSTGLAGWRDDDLAFVTDWGFGLDAVGKVAVWQGSEDLMVPKAHGAWLARHIPGARARLRRGEGHLSIGAGGLGPVFDDLIDLAGL
ncbi:MAG TPA: alpha/beta fold hydrolase [Streptosporangiaceae bacterium]|jgi:pimeloyl-ACP methyl ester carboxylesterase